MMTRPDPARVLGEAGAMIRLALPLITGQLAAVGMSTVDALLAGHYSAQVLAAVAIGSSLWSLAVVTTIGVMMALQPTVAQLVGAGKRDQVGPLFRQSWWLAAVLGVGLLLFVREAAPLLMRGIGVDPSLWPQITDFLHAVAWGMPALAFYFTLRGVSEGLGHTRPTMYFGFLGLALLAPVGYVLMFGKLGLPPQGARGSGMATAIILWIDLLAFAAYARRAKVYQDLNLFQRPQRPNWVKLAALLRLGLPMAVSLMMEMGLFVAAALAIGRLGVDPEASHQIALNVASLTFMVPLGMSMAITVRIGFAVGRGDVSAIRYAGFTGIALTLLTQSLSTVLMLSIPHGIAGLYTNNTRVVALAAQLLILAGMFQFSDGIQVASAGALRGLKDTRVPMFITIFAYWVVGFPLGLWFAFGRGLGVRGMWMGLISGLSMAALLLFTRFYLYARRPLLIGLLADDANKQLG